MPAHPSSGPHAGIQRNADFGGQWLLAPRAIQSLQARLLAFNAGAFKARARRMDSGAYSTSPMLPYTKQGKLAIVPIIGTLTKYPSFDPDLDGWMGFCPSTSIQTAIQAALADASIDGIVLRIDTPGGVVNGTIELADTVNAAKKVKPVYAGVSGCCLSGGYYVASQCSRITANSSADVGCIGVYSVLTDLSRMFEQAGVSQALVTSGRYKGLGADGRVTSDAIEDTQRMVNDVQALFVAAVASGRKMDRDAVEALADGRAWIAQQAVDFGLIDSVASFDDALAGFAKPPRSAPAARRVTHTSSVQRRHAFAHKAKPAAPPRPLTPQQRAEKQWDSMDSTARSHWIDRATFIRVQLREHAKAAAAGQ